MGICQISWFRTLEQFRTLVFVYFTQIHQFLNLIVFQNNWPSLQKAEKSHQIFSSVGFKDKLWEEFCPLCDKASFTGNSIALSGSFLERFCWIGFHYSSNGKELKKQNFTEKHYSSALWRRIVLPKNKLWLFLDKEMGSSSTHYYFLSVLWSQVLNTPLRLQC